MTLRRIRVNQNGLKLNGTHQLLVYADDVNILDGSIHTVKENTEASVVASKETGLEINSDKTKYIACLKIRMQDSHSIKTDNSSFERLEDIKYLGTTLKNQNSIEEDNTSKLKSGDACYHSVQHLLSSSLLSKNIKIKIYRTLILPVLFYGCETWSLTLREERRLKMFEKRVLRSIFGPKKDEVTGEWRKLHNKEQNDLFSLSIVRVIKLRRIRWVGPVARMGERRGVYRVLVGKPERRPKETQA